jgi:hypothetical protein
VSPLNVIPANIATRPPHATQFLPLALSARRQAEPMGPWCTHVCNHCGALERQPIPGLSQSDPLISHRAAALAKRKAAR